MITTEDLLSYEKIALSQIADTLLPEEIRQLIAWLDDKDRKNDRILTDSTT